VQLVEEGKTASAIAVRMNLSRGTIQGKIATLGLKLKGAPGRQRAPRVPREAAAPVVILPPSAPRRFSFQDEQ
jgi:DNA-binding NarL/FixJ family response regulator